MKSNIGENLPDCTLARPQWYPKALRTPHFFVDPTTFWICRMLVNRREEGRSVSVSQDLYPVTLTDIDHSPLMMMVVVVVVGVTHCRIRRIAREVWSWAIGSIVSDSIVISNWNTRCIRTVLYGIVPGASGVCVVAGAESGIWCSPDISSFPTGL